MGSTLISSQASGYQLMQEHQRNCQEAQLTKTSLVCLGLQRWGSAGEPTVCSETDQ